LEIIKLPINFSLLFLSFPDEIYLMFNPPAGVINNILSDSHKLFFIFDDVLIIIPLPNHHSG
jgi:hypothetical protein